MFLVNSIHRFIKSGESRSVRIKKNILFSFLIRGMSVAINLSVVSLAVDYVNSIQYGIWVTLTSIISWFTYFDFGMGNGLRNRLATAMSFNDHQTAKKYVSTTYAFFSALALVVFLLFSVVNPLISWESLLNVPHSGEQNLNLVILVLVATLCVQFVVQLINTVLNSLHAPAKAEFLTLLGQAGMLVMLIVLKFTTEGNLKILIIALNVLPLMIMLLSSLVLYQKSYRHVAPSFRSIEIKYIRAILNVGGAFFLIQIGSLVLHQTDNIIITRILGPGAVTTFNVTYKLYSVITMVFALVGTPYWSAFTDAWVQKDFQWIRKNVKGLRDVWMVTAFILVPIFFMSSKFLVNILFPDVEGVQVTLLASMALYVISSTCLSLNCFFLYGIGKLRILLLMYLIVTISNVPLGLALGKLYGIEGVIFSNIIAFVFMNIVLWVQTNKILNKTAGGIWNL